MDEGMERRTNARRLRKPPYGPNIVRAWFDTVFHPMLSGLENEISFLDRRNWTFRQDSEMLGHIAPVVGYVGRARENLEQFVSFFSDVEMLTSRHDELVACLSDSCLLYFNAVLENEQFLRAYENARADALKVLKRDFHEFFGSYSTEDEFKRILAEYIVNNLGSLPHYYATAQLWNYFRDAFVSATGTQGLASHREATEQAGRKLEAASENLIAAMKTIRSELSLRFDLPVVAELSTTR